jgi:hypothetical protein
VLTREGRTAVFDDPGAAPGGYHEYRMHRLGRPPLGIVVAHGGEPPRRRGRALLLVDRTLADRIGAALAEYRRDLVADGWEVLQHAVPRHVDWADGDWTCARYDAEAIAPNREAVAAVKALIRREHEARRDITNVVVLVGHVAMPQSGWAAEDGHLACNDPAGIHLGAWNADIWYGDMSSGWTDTTNHATGCPGCTRSQCQFCTLGNTAGDGRFDQNFLPREADGTPARIELAVGRIDFARLAHFTNTAAGLRGAPTDLREVEVLLLERYFDKLARYRRGQLPFADQAIGYANVLAPVVEDNIVHIAPRLWDAGPLPQTTLASDAFHDGPPVRWAFHVDYSHFDVIGMPGAARPGHTHLARDIAVGAPGNVPRAAFLFAFGSFMNQWFSGYGGDVLRTTLAAPGSALVVASARGFLPWITDRVHAGAPVHALLTDSAERHATVNARLAFLLGDPCLREETAAPPRDFTATAVARGVRLAWRAPNPLPAGYRICRAASTDAADWTEVSVTGPEAVSLVDVAARRGDVFRIQSVAEVRNRSGRYRHWSGPAFAIPGR